MTRTALTALMAFSLLAGPALAGMQMLDDGVMTKQIVADGSDLYILKDSGQVWQHRFGQFTQLDNGTNSRMLAAGDGKLFLLKDTGKVFQNLGGNRWKMVDDGQNSRQITTARGRLYLLKETGHIWRFARDQWTRLDDGVGTKQIEAVGDALWVLKENGNVWKYDEFRGRFEKIDDGSQTRSIAGTPFGCVILKDSGELWSFKHGQFSRLEMNPSFSQLTVDGSRLFVLGRDGRVTRFDLDFGQRREVQTPPGDVVKQITAGQGNLYLLQQRGNVWTQSDSPWAPEASRSAAFEQLHAED